MNQTPPDGFYEDFMRREKADKLARFQRLNALARPGQILFAGSSLMEQFPIQELLLSRGLSLPVYNRGVGGFTTAELLDALEPCVLALSPRHIFLNIGTNDMNGPGYTLDGLLQRYGQILAAIQDRLPRTGLTLLAYYPLCEPVLARGPMGGMLQTRNNAAIAQANRGVEQLAQKMGAEFLDCNAVLTDETGGLREEYTVEGMHLYATAYDRVLDLLLPRLLRL